MGLGSLRLCLTIRHVGKTARVLLSMERGRKYGSEEDHIEQGVSFNFRLFENVLAGDQ